MTINKLDEFAKNGDKSISGLILTAGFPLKQKPFRQWFNWILNDITKKTNELVTDVNGNSQAVIDNANAIVNLDNKVAPLFEPIQVGELFVTTNDYQSPQDVMVRHGYGTWVRYAEGKTLVGYSQKAGDPASYKTMGNEFGANTHKLTIPEIPSHKHSQNEIFNKFAARASDVTAEYATSAKTVTDADNVSAEVNLMVSGQNTKAWTESTELSVGADEPHNNIQPSIVAAYWLRTA